MKNIWIGLCLAMALTACGTNEGETMSKSVMAENGIALSGYDAVSYFEEHPQHGSPEHRYTYHGVDWLFVDADHRDRFIQAPERYMPQYGGHCALAMSFGEMAPGDPQSWHIKDNKLYFHNGKLTRFVFNLFSGRQTSADTHWQHAQ